MRMSRFYILQMHNDKGWIISEVFAFSNIFEEISIRQISRKERRRKALGRKTRRLDRVNATG